MPNPVRALDLNALESRLKAVQGRPWRFDPDHEMFIGKTNALEMYTRTLDLGRDNLELVPYYDEASRTLKYQKSEACKRNIAEIRALGEFFEHCRGDMAALLDCVRRLDREEAVDAE